MSKKSKKSKSKSSKFSSSLSSSDLSKNERNGPADTVADLPEKIGDKPAFHRGYTNLPKGKERT